MFGFSLTKIVFTAVVVFVVWNAFKYFTRLQDTRKRNARVQGRDKPSGGVKPTPDKGGVEDMVECKVCGAYVARGAKPCGRGDCPF